MHQEHKELLQELYETYQKALRLAALSKKVPECEVNDICPGYVYGIHG